VDGWRRAWGERERLSLQTRWVNQGSFLTGKSLFVGSAAGWSAAFLQVAGDDLGEHGAVVLEGEGPGVPGVALSEAHAGDQVNVPGRGVCAQEPSRNAKVAALRDTRGRMAGQGREAAVGCCGSVVFLVGVAWISRRRRPRRCRCR
jgi:hypothetical protein